MEATWDAEHQESDCFPNKMPTFADRLILRMSLSIPNISDVFKRKNPENKMCPIYLDSFRFCGGLNKDDHKILRHSHP